MRTVWEVLRMLFVLGVLLAIFLVGMAGLLFGSLLPTWYPRPDLIAAFFVGLATLYTLFVVAPNVFSASVTAGTSVWAVFGLWGAAMILFATPIVAGPLSEALILFLKKTSWLALIAMGGGGLLIVVALITLVVVVRSRRPSPATAE